MERLIKFLRGKDKNQFCGATIVNSISMALKIPSAQVRLGLGHIFRLRASNLVKQGKGEEEEADPVVSAPVGRNERRGALKKGLTSRNTRSPP